MSSTVNVADELSRFLVLGGLLEEIRKRWGSYELLDHWQQGEFHHDLVLRSPGALSDLGGEILVVATNCNGGVKELLCFEAIPERQALWHARCPDNPDFSGDLPQPVASARTEHWFDPRDLLGPKARSEYREEFRQRQCGGGWVPRRGTAEPAIALLGRQAGRNYEAAAISHVRELQLGFHGEPFACLLWDHGSPFTASARSQLAAALLEADCRYVVCGGANCRAWHDDLDEELYARQQNDSDAPSAAVLTSSHEGESPDEVAYFFVFNTAFDDRGFQHHLVLHVGRTSERAALDAAVKRYALSYAG